MVCNTWRQTEQQTPDRRTAGYYHKCLLVALSRLVEYLKVTRATVVFGCTELRQNAYKLLSGEHGEQQDALINNSKPSAYGTPGLALSNMCRRP